jgi:hypothetical protein
MQGSVLPGGGDRREPNRLGFYMSEDLFLCRYCLEGFDRHVWHCPTPGCDHHWLIERKSCGNCNRENFYGEPTTKLFKGGLKKYERKEKTNVH